MRILLLGPGSDSFARALDEVGVSYERRSPQASPGVAMNASGDILRFTGRLAIGALATILATWAHADSDRKVTITTANRSVIHAEGYSAKQLERILRRAREVAVIDTNKPVEDEHGLIHLRFEDFEVGELLAASTPPKGVTISKPETLVQASEDTGGIFLSMVITFVAGVPVSVLGAWIYDCLKKAGKSRTTINREEIEVNEHTVQTFLKKEVTKTYRIRSEREQNDDAAG